MWDLMDIHCLERVCIFFFLIIIIISSPIDMCSFVRVWFRDLPRATSIKNEVSCHKRLMLEIF